MTEHQNEQPQGFDPLGLDTVLLRAVHKMHWTEPSEIQAKLIPVALTGRDVMGQARTGTGKTGAFALPVLQRMPAGEGVRCLVLTPTRELAAQVARDFRELARYTDHKVTVAYGGTRVRQQAVELKQHPAVVVGTPGRVMDLMKRKLLRLNSIRFAILDEVDRMLDIGFRDDIRKILGRITSEHQTIFVSATIDEEINRLARRYMHDPAEVFLAPDKLTVEEVEQFYLPVQPHDKRRLLAALLKQEDPELAIVFTRTKRETDRVAERLTKAGINARAIHGDLYQRKRDRVLKQFRGGEINVLVATDLASRGLDIDDITHIINYDPPDEAGVYVHRVGRTARMGAAGKAFTLVTPAEGGILTEIEKLINKEIRPASVDGFNPSEKPEAKAEIAEQSPALNRMNAPLYEDDDAPATPVRRTLGSKFPPRRRRRL
ncbi:MAG: DEAD/DEAH box helicase [Planctomycetota bacterium]